MDFKFNIVLFIFGKLIMDIGNLIFMILKNDFGENFIIIDCDVKCLCGCISDIIKN